MGLALLAAALRLWTPLVFAAMGGIVSERSGVINIALEGMMLGGAFASVAAARATGNAFVGLLAGVLAGALIGLLHAFFTQALRVSHILSGVALNIGVLGLTSFAFRNIILKGGEGLDTKAQLPGELMVLVAVAVIAATWFVLYKTPLGLRLRACGENARAARSAGVAVPRLRYGAVIVSGALAGLGGVALALTGLGAFAENMTAGRGYIALAAVIFGRWHRSARRRRPSVRPRRCVATLTANGRIGKDDSARPAGASALCGDAYRTGNAFRSRRRTCGPRQNGQPVKYRRKALVRQSCGILAIGFYVYQDARDEQQGGDGGIHPTLARQSAPSASRNGRTARTRSVSRQSPSGDTFLPKSEWCAARKCHRIIAQMPANSRKYAPRTIPTALRMFSSRFMVAPSLTHYTPAMFDTTVLRLRPF